nr:hypothetical protein [Acidobacteriota bacterium]NIO60819.1 hypothetical protein [Acidobacteriota bacterium]NIQ31891.1 hypothetical protein [Acidobacteriota bacterium]NIQ87271.1 hypothetical protein [Acidobacteriota bacterium]NIT12487.1 hypothetical protein [Acidobacteriota bacterium]
MFDGDTPLTLDEGIALCAQCHVEYVCGNSPIDGIDRDYFPWARHYGNDAKCFARHMPKVTRTGDSTQFTSHWLASPLKYLTPEPAATFAATFGV